MSMENIASKCESEEGIFIFIHNNSPNNPNMSPMPLRHHKALQKDFLKCFFVHYFVK